jgi:hypothetical protein
VESDGGWTVVACAGLAGFLDAVAVVAGAFEGAGEGAVAPGGIDLAGDLGVDIGEGLSPVLRGVSGPAVSGQFFSGLFHAANCRFKCSV